jgi:hypothetical protein
MDDTLTVHEASVSEREPLATGADGKPAQPAETPNNLVDMPGVGAIEMAPTLHAPHGAPVAHLSPGRPRVAGEVPPALRGLLDEFPLDRNVIDLLFAARDLAEGQIGTCEGFARCGECNASELGSPRAGWITHEPGCNTGCVLEVLVRLKTAGFNIARKLSEAGLAASGPRLCAPLGEPWTCSVKPFGGVGIFDAENRMIGSFENLSVAERAVDCVNSCAPKAVRQ